MQGDQHEHRSPQQRAEHGVGDDEPFAVVPVHDRAAEHVADMRGNLAERGEHPASTTDWVSEKAISEIAKPFIAAPIVEAVSAVNHSTICGVAPQRFTALRGSAFAVWRGLRLR